MNDRQIEALIDDLIQEKGITLWDMIGAQYIDPEMKIGDSCGNPRTSRWNKFKAESWDDRLIELISDREAEQYPDYHSIRIPLKDLIRFWWNRCIDKDCMLEIIFEDIYCYFKDKMIPITETKKINLKPDFSQLQLDWEFKKAVNQ